MTATAPIPPDPLADGETGSRQRIGTLLRRTREGARIELAAAAATLRIRPSYLDAIEKGASDRLPGPTYAVGFVRTYAEYLGLDGEEAVRRFKREAQGFDAAHDLALPGKPVETRGVPGGRILVTAAVLAICGYGLWYYYQSSNVDHQAQIVPDVPTALLKTQTGSDGDQPASPGEARAAPPATAMRPPGTSEVEIPPDTPRTPTPPGVAVETGPGAPPAANATSAALTTPPDAAAPGHVFGQIDGPVRIVLRITDDCWVQIKDTKQDIVFGKLLHAGDVFRVPQGGGLTLRTGNSEGLAIYLDGKPVVLPLANSRVRNVALDPDRLTAGDQGPPMPPQPLPPAPIPAAAPVPATATPFVTPPPTEIE